MKTLATSLVAIQEVSENLNTGLALENLNGEYFYVNDSWPKIYETTKDNSITRYDADLYPPDLIKEIREADAEILSKKVPVGYIISDGNENENEVHLILKFTINYTTGEPFCFCTLAKKIENENQFHSLMERIKEVFHITHDSAFKLVNRATCC